MSRVDKGYNDSIDAFFLILDEYARREPNTPPGFKTDRVTCWEDDSQPYVILHDSRKYGYKIAVLRRDLLDDPDVKPWKPVNLIRRPRGL